MSAFISWLVSTFGPLGAAIIVIILGGLLLRYAFWSLATLLVAVTVRSGGTLSRLLGRFLNTLVGTVATSDQHYECECGAPMEILAQHSTTDCTIQTWECTECLRGGQAYRFDDDEHDYGTGPLAGQVNP